MKRHCVICNKLFVPANDKILCCSHECSVERNKRNSQKRYYATIRASKESSKRVITCPICGTEFVTYYKEAKYCSKECRDASKYIQKRYKAGIRNGFYHPDIPDDYDWNEYGMPSYNEFLDKWEKDIPWYQSANSIQMCIDPYPV